MLSVQAICTVVQSIITFLSMVARLCVLDFFWLPRGGGAEPGQNNTKILIMTAIAQSSSMFMHCWPGPLCYLVYLRVHVWTSVHETQSVYFMWSNAKCVPRLQDLPFNFQTFYRGKPPKPFLLWPKAKPPLLTAVHWACSAFLSPAHGSTV